MMGRSSDVQGDSQRAEPGKECEKESSRKKVNLYELFGYADSVDMLLMFLGCIGSVIFGVTTPMSALIFAQIINSFGELRNDLDATAAAITKAAIDLVYLGAASTVSILCAIWCWTCSGERQASRIKNLYLQAILRQDMAFFDMEINTGEAIASLSGDTLLIQHAIGLQMGKALQLLTSFVGSFAVAFSRGWKLTLVTCLALPFLIVAGAVVAYLISKIATQGQSAYAKANTIVDQVIVGIRTVASFTGEKKALKEYDKALEIACNAGIKQGWYTGLGFGSTMFIIFGTYALTVWYGSILIIHEQSNGGSIVCIIMVILIGGMALGQTSECFNAFAAGQAAAFKMFKALRRTPEIDILDSSGVVLDILKGKIEFQNVYFSYPARPEAPVLRDFSLAIPSGTSVALIGESGSGKSTIVSLVERFYDPQSGKVLLDTIDIKAMQVRWLRQQIGLVSQEPALFGGSIRDNLSVGKEAATFDEISNACQIANASSFIEKLPQGYDTHVGESGAMLSGGQRQRIAIARALLKNPRILLLDEATSALDTTSEHVVQEALNRVMLNRTTIIVAHRLSTIRDANVIVVLQQGKIVEKGTHANLLQDPTSAYSQLVRLQASHPKNDQTSNFNFDRSRASPGYGGSTFVHSPSPLRSPLRSPFRSPRKWSFMNPNFGMQFSNESFSIQSFELEEQVIPSNNSTPYYFSRQQNDCERGSSIPSRVNGSLSRLAKLGRPEAPILMLAVAATAVLGAVFPVFGFVFANAISSFFETNHMKLRKTANFWAGIFVLMGVIYQVFSPIKECGFSRAGNRLIRRVCNLIFDKVLRQEIGWFDDSRNSSGAISGRLSTDVVRINSIMRDMLGLLVMNTTNLVVCLGIAFSACWQLALLMLATIPLIGLQAYLQMKYSNMDTRSKVVHEEANNVAHNAISNIRTVASFCAGEHVALLYKKTSKVSIRQGIQEGIISGCGVGFSTLISYACNVVSLWYGGQLIKIQKTTFQHVFVVYYAMSMTTMLMSRCLEMIPDINKVRATFHSIFEILDYKSKIDPSETTGCTVAKSQGAIRFRHVSFAYPSRPDVQIFRNLSFSCPAGKTLALVGESGCGKSTVVSLLERFYDPDSGNIYLDNVEIKKLQLRWLRQQIGLVSQEPLLFDGTIRSNIEYGTDKECTEAEIQTAARAANAHDFIASLPDGYNTDVSERGANLSGGQRQRIAIARAILKDPKVLLLDEATSALDAESERAVQEALDRFITNRSSIVIAHRLSSIANAHTIAVVKNGEIVEQGSHYELIKLRGAYATLANVQMLASTKK